MPFKPSILFLDDDMTLHGTFRRIFRKDWVDICVVAYPWEALELVASREFHVLASDYQMPGMNGVEFLVRAKEICPDAQSLLISGLADFDAAVAALNAGVNRLICKPWNPEELRQVVLRAAEYVYMKKENDWLNRILQDKNQELKRLNHELQKRVNSRTQNVLDGLVSALDYRDMETQLHSRRVAAYSKTLAQIMGIKGQELRDIEWGALLHDIGKIGVRDEILLKPGSLTPSEWAEMKAHCRLGYELLTGIDFLKNAAKIVLQHHERYDGNGYPDRLKGDEIVVGARIFSAVDTLDAMTSDRPYQRAVSFQKAAEEIRRVNGTQLDTAVVDAFLTLEESAWDDLKNQLVCVECDHKSSGFTPLFIQLARTKSATA